ncbi:glycosyl hydrolase family 8, partial [Klebsiella pneumoniae]|uniref:glycosyl hydrolase family 8 n=1 Tax=Klebsiella pneumoniae TaxID=573 RepID=UPI002230B1B0
MMMLPHAWADTAWESYKSRFMMPDGRIIDTGNGNVSHTEGQGFAMLLAVANNDRPAFDKLWQWTDKTLRNKDNGL